ncbi:MAG TPA: glycine oxidase ThiO [Solirubrobacterales bacterium]
MEAIQDRKSGYDAVFVGGGVIGLASAWRAAARGAHVCVLERNRPAAGASAVAAGMLAPVGETSWGEQELLALNFESLRRWPEFAGELEEQTGHEVEFAVRGALHVALDRDEAEELRRNYELHRELGLESEWLAASACRKLEPGLTTAVRGGAHVPGEAMVDPRKVGQALIGALEESDVSVESGAEVVGGTRRAGSWHLETRDGREFEAANVVVTAGCWSGSVDWLPAGARPPVRPVKGEIITLRGAANEPPCERIIGGERIYLVPRADGRLIVGATVEELGFDTRLTAGGVHELLRESYRLLPEIAELELVETRVGLRPGTPDNAPFIGHGPIGGLLIATGHFRNGILLTPVTCDSIAALLAGEAPPLDLEPFSPQRFAEHPADSAVEVA